MRKHEHSTASQKPRSLLVVAAALTLVTFFVEVGGGLWTNSVGLISDAGHVFMDLMALVFSLAALTLAQKPISDRRTFGLHRLEVFAAFLNGVLVAGAAVWILYEAVSRLKAPPPIRTLPMLGFAVSGLIVNLFVAWKLHDFARQDINIRGAFVHVLGDTLASLGVIVGGILIYMTGLFVIDPIIGVFVAAVILFNAAKILKESIEILLEGVPKHIILNDLIDAISSVQGVERVDDTHVWNICSHISSLSAHVTLQSGLSADQQKIVDQINAILHNRFHIGHSTIQIHFAGGSAETHTATVV